MMTKRMGAVFSQRADAWPAELADPRPTIHSMRHSTATWWLAASLSVHEVAELLGHTDAKGRPDATLVLRLYGHALPTRRATAGERLETFLAESGGA